jgi:hypothetical protein
VIVGLIADNDKDIRVNGSIDARFETIPSR